MVLLKGVTLKSTLKYNKEILGEKAVDSFINQLSDASREVLTGMILDTSWYSLDHLIEFTDFVFKTILGKNEDALKKGSRYIAEKQVTGIHKPLLGVGTTENMVKRMPSINDRYYQGVGIKTEYLDANKLKVTYSGFEKKHRLHEIITMAWWEVVFENLDAKNVSTKIGTSLAEDKGYFDFIITWEKK
jgi:hypothetical protein